MFKYADLKMKEKVNPQLPFPLKSVLGRGLAVIIESV